jgi:hypothetical protein
MFQGVYGLFSNAEHAQLSSGDQPWRLMKGGRTSNDVRAKIGEAAALTHAPKSKGKRLAKGGHQSTADRVWIDGLARPRRPHPAAAETTLSV